jgi:hypothetical protein
LDWVAAGSVPTGVAAKHVVSGGGKSVSDAGEHVRRFGERAGDERIDAVVEHCAYGWQFGDRRVDSAPDRARAEERPTRDSRQRSLPHPLERDRRVVDNQLSVADLDRQPRCQLQLRHSTDCQRERAAQRVRLDKKQPVLAQGEIRPGTQHHLHDADPSVNECACSSWTAEHGARRAHRPDGSPSSATPGDRMSRSSASALTASRNGPAGW